MVSNEYFVFLFLPQTKVLSFKWAVFFIQQKVLRLYFSKICKPIYIVRGRQIFQRDQIEKLNIYKNKYKYRTDMWYDIIFFIGLINKVKPINRADNVG